MRLKVDDAQSGEVREVLKLKSGSNVTLDLVNEEAAEVELRITASGGAGVGFSKLSANANAGVTSITVDTLPGVMASNRGQFVMLDVGTTEAELREITTVSGNTLSFTRALTYSHVIGDAVYLVGDGAQGDLIPWSWWGGIAGSSGNTDAAATINVTAFNRLMGPSGEIYNAGRFGISIDGSYYVNDQLKPERSTVMQGESSLTSSILARSGFPFTAVGDVAIIHPYRDGSPVLFEQAGPSGRWWFRNFEVNGQSLTDSNGIISSPQQPDSTENIRIRNCAGDYGLNLVDVQYHDVRNVQFDNCALSLYMWGCQFVRIYNLNFTSPTGTSGIKLTGSTNNSFYGGLFETLPTGGKIIDIGGGSSRLSFYDIYTSGFSGGSTGDVFYINSVDNPSGKCTYFIANAYCAQNASTINFVNDVQRGITFNTSIDSDRALVFGYAQDDLHFFALGAGEFRQSAQTRFAPWGTGPIQIARSGTPEGAVAAPVGSICLRTDGGAGTSFYVKESGTGNTGWVAK